LPYSSSSFDLVVQTTALLH